MRELHWRVIAQVTCLPRHPALSVADRRTLVNSDGWRGSLADPRCAAVALRLATRLKNLLQTVPPPQGRNIEHRADSLRPERTSRGAWLRRAVFILAVF